LPRLCTIVAFDGDDTLWIDDTEEKRWERECKRLCVAGLPHPDMANAFHRHVSAFRYTQEGVQRALIESAREVCGGDVPAEWRADIDAIPGLVASLNLRFPHGLERALDGIAQNGHSFGSSRWAISFAKRSSSAAFPSSIASRWWRSLSARTQRLMRASSPRMV
jgi:hypothetical protein